MTAGADGVSSGRRVISGEGVSAGAEAEGTEVTCTVGAGVPVLTADGIDAALSAGTDGSAVIFVFIQPQSSAGKNIRTIAADRFIATSKKAYKPLHYTVLTSNYIKGKGLRDILLFIFYSLFLFVSSEILRRLFDLCLNIAEFCIKSGFGAKYQKTGARAEDNSVCVPGSAAAFRRRIIMLQCLYYLSALFFNLRTTTITTTAITAAAATAMMIMTGVPKPLEGF